MTPLAARLFRSGDEDTQRRLAAAQFFECTALTPLALEMRKADDAESGFSSSAQLPAPKTLIEIMLNGKRMAFFCQEHPEQEHVAVHAISGDVNGGIHIAWRATFTPGSNDFSVDEAYSTSRENEDAAVIGLIFIEKFLCIINQQGLVERKARNTDKRILREAKSRDFELASPRWHECHIRPGVHGSENDTSGSHREHQRKRAEDRIADADTRFNEAVSDLKVRVEGFPAMAPLGQYPAPSAAKTAEEEIRALTEHFVKAKSTALDAAKSVLGPDFDAEDRPAREGLERDIPLARSEISQLGKLEGAARLSGLGKLSDGEIDSADALLAKVGEEAITLSSLVANPGVASRKQLYAAVASWTIANGKMDDSHCHVCNRPLLEEIDPITGKRIQVHLEEARLEEPELLSQTVKLWASSRIAMLADKLPPVLRDERDKDLPASPSALLRQAIVIELFSSQSFAGPLAVLQSETADSFDAHISGLSEYEEPEGWQAPLNIESELSDLQTAIRRIHRAIAFARWRKNAKEPLIDLFASVIGKDVAASTEEPISTTSPLKGKLAALQGIIEGAQPITDALEYCDRMAKAIEARRKQEQAIVSYSSAVSALGSLEKLGSLAATQVKALQANLDASANRWRTQIYVAPVSGPSIKKTAMSAAGVIEFQAGANGMGAPAQHIANASALRAALVAFFLAFRDYVLKTRGGLELLLLDDPQELLDEHNRGRMANTVVALASGSAQLMVTTYDRSFAMMVAAGANAKCSFTHSSIHGVNALRSTLSIAPAKAKLDEDKAAFERNIDDHGSAAQYASTVRIYVETRLRDLFDDPAYPAYATTAMRPTLADNLNHLRSLVATKPSALFEHPAVLAFSRHPSLVDASECYSVLNDAHHTPSAVTYGRVTSVAGQLSSVSKAIEDVHRAFRDWRATNQLPPVVANDNATSLKSVVASSKSYLIHPDLAAFSGPGEPQGSQEGAEDIFSSSWFDDKSLFYVRSSNFGFSIPKGYIAIVESSPEEARDRNLVIARKTGEVLARRLFKSGDGYALAAETPDPRESPPTKIAKGNDYQLHRVVGCLLLETSPPTSRQEAVQIDRDRIADEIKAVYRLNKESAVPFALPRQLLLGGDYILPSDLAQHEGQLAAITLKDGSELLKRIGSAISPKFPHVRHFETLGGLGKSIVLQTEEVEDGAFDAPIIDHARIAIGVIYED